MLLRFACKNFRSLRDEQELSMIAGSGHEHEDTVIEAPSIRNRVLRSAAIYGANASGKSNVIRALSFFSAVIENSHVSGNATSNIPRHRFKLDDDEDLPSYFEADFLLEKERFTYGFELNDREILREWLYAFPTGRRVVWYERQGAEPINFGRSLAGRNRVIESLTRKNSLFLSAAAQNNHEQLTPIFSWFQRGFGIVGPDNRQPISTANICSKDNDVLTTVKSLMRFADLGIVDFKISDEDVDQKTKELLVLLMKDKPESIPEQDIPSKVKRITMLHQGKSKSYEIDLDEESDGTTAYFSLLGPVLRAMSRGSMLLIDELESSLHPMLAKEIVKLFNDPKINCKGAQFLFTTHDPNLLNLDTLRRDQIWFTEKDQEGATALYPLSEFSIRNNFDVAKGYLEGRFGAIPFLNDTLLKQIESSVCDQNG